MRDARGDEEGYGKEGEMRGKMKGRGRREGEKLKKGCRCER